MAPFDGLACRIDEDNDACVWLCGCVMCVDFDGAMLVLPCDPAHEDDFEAFATCLGRQAWGHEPEVSYFYPETN